MVRSRSFHVRLTDMGALRNSWETWVKNLPQISRDATLRKAANYVASFVVHDTKGQEMFLVRKNPEDNTVNPTPRGWHRAIHYMGHHVGQSWASREGGRRWEARQGRTFPRARSFSLAAGGGPCHLAWAAEAWTALASSSDSTRRAAVRRLPW